MDFSYEELRDLNSVDKDDYIRKILEEDAQTSNYIKKVFDDAEDIQDKLVETELEINDIKEDWDKDMMEINNKLYQNAIKNGITREQFKFIELKIKDHDREYLAEKEERLKELIDKYRYILDEKDLEVDATGNRVQVKDIITDGKRRVVFRGTYDQHEGAMEAIR